MWRHQRRGRKPIGCSCIRTLTERENKVCGVSLLSSLKLWTFNVLVDETSVLLEEFSPSFYTGATLAKEKAKLYFGLWKNCHNASRQVQWYGTEVRKCVWFVSSSHCGANLYSETFGVSSRFLYRLRDLDDVRLILGFKEIRGNILCCMTPYFSSSSLFNCVKCVRF